MRSMSRSTYPGKAAGPKPPRTVTIRPHPGPQEQFLSCPADVVIYGGAAGGGKSFALLLEAVRYQHVPGFGAVIFRRTSPQITNEGGLLDESKKLYARMGATVAESTLDWKFPNGNGIGFRHLEHDKDVYSWDGAQVPLIGFDQLESFTKAQFIYMLSRNRSVCGVRPYVRATCNPMPMSWILGLIDWWIDADGWPIKKRSGVIRYFVTVSEQFVTADTAEELMKRFPTVCNPETPPKSFTFIPSSLEDNPTLLAIDPGYKANIAAQSEHERLRLQGNWKARRNGKMFKWEWYQRCAPDEVPSIVKMCVPVDPSGGSEDGNDEQGIVPVGKGSDGNYYVFADLSCKLSPAGWGAVACNAYEDFKAGAVVGEKNYGGDMVESTIRAANKNVNYVGVTATRGKAVRAEPVAALYEKGKIIHVGVFDKLEAECVNFDPDAKRKSPNRMDALVWGVLYCMDEGNTGMLEFYRQQHSAQKRK